MEKQDKARMDGCFEKIPVQVGEVWYIPGGMPHAIGEESLCWKLWSRLIWWCGVNSKQGGIVVPEDGRFMGRGAGLLPDIFDYTEYSKEEIMENAG